MKPKDIYEKYLDGDPISNKELLEAIPVFDSMARQLRQFGPVFKLAARELDSVLRGLEDYRMARGLKFKEEPVLTWAEVLNDIHIKHSCTISSVMNYANELGYPYFIWNDRVYKSSGDVTGITRDQIV